MWIDLEMTGLDPDTCHILEIASVVTNSDLEVLGEGPDLVVHQPDEILSSMNEWCQVHHAESGLTDRVKASAISLERAEALTLEFLSRHTEPDRSPLCGNSISLDQRFLRRHMPRLYSFLSPDIIDVSTVKELARRWYPNATAPKKADSHRAREDILESIAELRLYREQLMR